jgi:hypothetical protein
MVVGAASAGVASSVSATSCSDRVRSAEMKGMVFAPEINIE